MWSNTACSLTNVNELFPLTDWLLFGYLWNFPTGSLSKVWQLFPVILCQGSLWSRERDSLAANYFWWECGLKYLGTYTVPVQWGCLVFFFIFNQNNDHYSFKWLACENGKWHSKVSLSPWVNKGMKYTVWRNVVILGGYSAILCWVWDMQAAIFPFLFAVWSNNAILPQNQNPFIFFTSSQPNDSFSRVNSCDPPLPSFFAKWLDLDAFEHWSVLHAFFGLSWR